jgi:type IX secretion system PorP/SprF family membrane protein
MQKQMKNLRNIFILAFTLALIAKESKAQQVPLFNQYYYSGSLPFPSSTVFQENRYLSLVYRDQFGGLVGSPKNFALAYNTAIKGRKAFSVNVATADIGFTSQVKLSGGMGYKLFGKGKDGLSVGAQMGLSLFSLNEERVNPENPADNVLIDVLGQNGSSLSFDFSMSYKKGKFGIDLAVPNLINESLSNDGFVQINDDNVPDFIGGARYAFSINPDLIFTPYAGIRLRETIGGELDLMGEFNFKDKFRFTAGYRDNYGPSMGLGLNIFPQLLFTYNYDFGEKDAPFLADGFNEFGLHLQLNDKVDQQSICATEGEAVVNRIIDQKIFDENLVSADDKDKALCYFASLEVGKSRQKNLKAEQAYQALFVKVKADELENQEIARLAKLQEEQQVKADREQAELRAEREKLAEIEKLKLKELERLAQIKEEEIKKALTLATESVSFKTGSSELTDESMAPLDKVVVLLNENKEIKLALAGFTDNTGNAEANLRLSQVRAEAVKAYLVLKGISSERIAAKGFGIADPRADNSTSEGRALNRRVEMKIVKN